MSYSTIDSVKKKIDEKFLIQLLNDENRPADEIDLTSDADLCVVRFNQAASEATDEINPFLRSRYTLPLSTTPAEITAISDDITIHNVYKRRSRENMPESITDIYKNCLKKLQQYQNGTLLLDVERLTDSVGSDSTIKVNKTSTDRIFNSDMWNKY